MMLVFVSSKIVDKGAKEVRKFYVALDLIHLTLIEF